MPAPSRVISLGGSFFIRINVPPPVRSGLQIFCETNIQNRRKKTFQVEWMNAWMNVMMLNSFNLEFVFSCKMGLKQWWTEHSHCTCSPLLPYTITECLSARSGFARSGPIYCHLYATILLMPTAYRHTSWHRDLFIVIIQEMTHMRFIPTHEFRVLMAREK